MIGAICSLLAIAFAVPTTGQATETCTFVSPCPDVFMYEPPGAEPGKWYGVVNLTTDTTLYALWLNIVLESKADILGNWVGEVTTEDNKDFKIENTKMKITPGPPLSIRFFIQYNTQNKPPALRAIRFNGREICNLDNPQEIIGNETLVRPDVNYRVPLWTDTYNSTTEISKVTSTRSTEQHTTFKPKYWIQAKTEASHQVKFEDKLQTTSRPQYWTQTKTEDKSQTTLRPQLWPNNKVDNNQQEISESKLQTRLDNKLQTTSTTKVQSTAQLWTQTKVENSQQRAEGKQKTEIEVGPVTPENKLHQKQQIWSQVKTEDQQKTRDQNKNTKPEDKLQIRSENNLKARPENFSQIIYEVTTQSQPWAQFKVEKTQQKKPDDRLQTKNENQSYTTVQPPIWSPVRVTENQHVRSENRQQTKTANESQIEVEQVVQTKYWPKITVGDNLRDELDSHTEVQQPIRSASKFEIDGTVHLQPINMQHKLDSTSHVISKDSQQIRPDDSYKDKSHERDTPIYLRPEESISILSDDILQTTNTRSENRQQARPVDSYLKQTEDRLQIKDDGRLEVRPIKRQEVNTENGQVRSEEKTLKWAGDRTQSWSEPGRSTNRVFESAGDSSITEDRIENEEGSMTSYSRYQLTTASPPPATTNTPEMDDFDNSNPVYELEDEEIDYYNGGLPTIYIPNHAPRGTESQCGKVLLNKPVGYNQRGSTLEGQWPWQIALYQQQSTVDFKYICGGTLVSRRHIITAAHCVTRKKSRRVVNKNTLTVYLGKHNLRTSVDGVQVKFVNKIIIHPEYNATTFNRDLAILELREPVTYSDWVQPVCLWPEDEIELKNVVGKKGSVVGWGYEVTGVAREELSLLEMPVVDQDTCVRSYIDFYKRFTSDYTYCAGYKDGTSICNGDSGGGMVFKKGNSWYLRGLASLSVARQGQYLCDPHHYVIFTDIAKLLPWIEENIEDY